MVQRGRGLTSAAADAGVFRLSVGGGKNDPEQGAGFARPARSADIQLSPVVLDHLPRERQAQSRAIVLAVGNKGLEEGIPDGLRDAGAVIPNADFNAVVPTHRGHFDLAGLWRYRLAGVQNDVGDNALESPRIKPSLGLIPHASS